MIKEEVDEDDSSVGSEIGVGKHGKVKVIKKTIKKIIKQEAVTKYQEDDEDVSEDEDIIDLAPPTQVKREQKFDNEYDRVCASLQLNAVPDFLPCREKERNYITDFLINGIHNGGSSSSLYISGMPGTGKTATTLEIIKRMRTTEFMRKNKLRPFDFIHINAMSLTNPNLVYSILHEKITGRRTNPTSSATFLDEFFKKKDKLKVLRDRIAKNAKQTKA